jgi:multidrug efflux pump subunit AcrB
MLSLLVARTLTPMMCAYLLKPESKEHGWLYRLSERGFDMQFAVLSCVRSFRYQIRQSMKWKGAASSLADST